MIKLFKVFQCLHQNGNPMCMALFMVNHKPYAWVDTIQHPTKLNSRILPVDQPCTPAEIATAVKELTGTAGATALYDYLIKKAQEQLDKRKVELKKKGQTYSGSRFAWDDIVQAYRPSLELEQLTGALKLERGHDPAQVRLDDGFGGYLLPDTDCDLSAASRADMSERAKWLAYNEPDWLIPLLTQVATMRAVPLPLQDAQINHPKTQGWIQAAKDTAKKNQKVTRMRSVRDRLTLLIELHQQYRKEMNAGCGWNVYVPCAFDDIKTPEQLRDMSQSDVDVLIEETLEWYQNSGFLNAMVFAAKGALKEEWVEYFDLFQGMELSRFADQLCEDYGIPRQHAATIAKRIQDGELTL